jgi:hypothetical protein
MVEATCIIIAAGQVRSSGWLGGAYRNLEATPFKSASSLISLTLVIEAELTPLIVTHECASETDRSNDMEIPAE